jgi:hypothetical protein
MATTAGPIIFATNALAMLAIIAIPFLKKLPFDPDFSTSDKWLTRFFYLTVLLVAVSSIVFAIINEQALAWTGLGFVIVSLLFTIVFPPLRLYTYTWSEDKRYTKFFTSALQKKGGQTEVSSYPGPTGIINIARPVYPLKVKPEKHTVSAEVIKMKKPQTIKHQNRLFVWTKGPLPPRPKPLQPRQEKYESSSKPRSKPYRTR